MLQVSQAVSELLEKVGATLADVLHASELDWSGKYLSSANIRAMAELFPACTGLKKIKCVYPSAGVGFVVACHGAMSHSIFTLH